MVKGNESTGYHSKQTGPISKREMPPGKGQACGLSFSITFFGFVVQLCTAQISVVQHVINIMRIFKAFNKGSQLSEIRVSFTGSLNKLFDATANSKGTTYRAFRADIDVQDSTRLISGHSYTAFSEFIGDLELNKRYEFSILKSDLVSEDTSKHRNFRIDAVATDSLSDLASLLE